MEKEVKIDTNQQPQQSNFAWLASKRRRLDQPSNDLTMDSDLSNFRSKNQVWTDVIKSPSDKRDYRVFMLANEMKVIVISDPTIDKSAVALSVQAGSMLDPKEYCGLAHLCERMILKANDKDSVENSFEKFLEKYGGEYSAFTQRDLTAFLFNITNNSVSPLALKEALERFSRYFIAPTFPENCVKSEVNSIEEEYQNRMQMDDERRSQVTLSLSKDHHPYGQFDCGNRETLWRKSEDRFVNEFGLVQQLKTFYKKYYSSNLMSLAVLGRESCQELQNLVKKLFSGIINSNKPIPRSLDCPYGPEQLMTKIELVPLEPIDKLFLIFLIPDYTPHYKTGTIPYLRFLLAYEGPGSLLSLLKKLEWVKGVEVDYEQPASGFAFLTLDFDLTLKGQENVNTLILHFFQYMKMIRQQEPQRWIWEEMKKINETKFKFLGVESSLNFVENLVTLMPIVPPEEILSCRYLLTEYKPQLIRELFNYLLPRNLRLILSSKNNEKIAHQMEYYYQVKFKYSSINDNLIQQWASCSFNEDFKLPPSNPFIPTQFNLKSIGNPHDLVPRVIEDNEFSRVWFLRDNEFNVPKATIILAIISPLPKQDPLNYNLMKIMGRIIDDSLTEFTCSANAAGLSFNIEASISGLMITVHGYDDKLEKLFNFILNRVFHFCSFGSGGDHFEQIVTEYFQELILWRDQEPYIHCIEHVENVLCNHSWTCDQLIKAMEESIPLSRFGSFAQKFLAHVKLQWLFFGNFTQTEALRIYQGGLEYFDCVKSKPLTVQSLSLLQVREIILAGGTTNVQLENKGKTDSAMVILLQSDMSGIRERVMMELIETILYEPAVEILATKNNLVWTDVRKSRGTLSFQIVMQGPKDPYQLEEDAENFFTSMKKTFSKMTQDTFLQHCITLAMRKNDKPKTFCDRGVKVFQKKFSEIYNFDSDHQELKEIQNINLKDLNEFYHNHIAPSAKNRKKLCIKIISSVEESPKKMITTKELPIEIKNSNTEISTCPGTNSEICQNSKKASLKLPSIRKLTASRKKSRSRAQNKKYVMTSRGVGDGDDGMTNKSENSESEQEEGETQFEAYYHEIEQEIKVLSNLKEHLLTHLKKSPGKSQNVQKKDKEEGKGENLECLENILKLNPKNIQCPVEYKVYTLHSISHDRQPPSNSGVSVHDSGKKKSKKKSAESNLGIGYNIGKHQTATASRDSSKSGRKVSTGRDLTKTNSTKSGKERQSSTSRERNSGVNSVPERKKSDVKLTNQKSNAKEFLPLKKSGVKVLEKENLSDAKSIRKLMSRKVSKNLPDPNVEMDVTEIEELDFDIKNEIKRLKNLRKLLDAKTKKIITKDSGEKELPTGEPPVPEEFKDLKKTSSNKQKRNKSKILNPQIDPEIESDQQDPNDEEILKNIVAMAKSKNKDKNEIGKNDNIKLFDQPGDKNANAFVLTNKDSLDGSFREQDLIQWLREVAHKSDDKEKETKPENLKKRGKTDKKNVTHANPLSDDEKSIKKSENGQSELSKNKKKSASKEKEMKVIGKNVTSISNPNPKKSSKQAPLPVAKKQSTISNKNKAQSRSKTQASGIAKNLKNSSKTGAALGKTDNFKNKCDQDKILNESNSDTEESAFFNNNKEIDSNESGGSQITGNEIKINGKSSSLTVLTFIDADKNSSKNLYQSNSTRQEKNEASNYFKKDLKVEKKVTNSTERTGTVSNKTDEKHGIKGTSSSEWNSSSATSFSQINCQENGKKDIEILLRHRPISDNDAESDDASSTPIARHPPSKFHHLKDKHGGNIIKDMIRGKKDVQYYPRPKLLQPLSTFRGHVAHDRTPEN